MLVTLRGPWTKGWTPMASSNVSLAHDSAQVAALLDSPEITALISQLEATRWTGRPGYTIRAMVGLSLVKSLYALPTWTRTVALVRDHDGLRAVLGAAPSTDAAYRFTVKMRKHKSMLEACIAKVLAALHAANPEMGSTVAIDGSDLPAYANGQRYVKRGGELRKRFADPDATWGHRSSISTRSGGGYYGYKVHCAVDTATGLPIAWQVETAKDSEIPQVPVLLDSVLERGFAAQVAILDRGYDTEALYTLLEGRGIRPVIPLRQTPAVKAGKHKPSSCEHGEWTFARHHFSHTWLDRGGAEGDLMELNGWSSPQMLRRYGASARSARARRTYDRIMTDRP